MLGCGQGTVLDRQPFQALCGKGEHVGRQVKGVNGARQRGQQTSQAAGAGAQLDNLLTLKRRDLIQFDQEVPGGIFAAYQAVITPGSLLIDGLVVGHGQAASFSHSEISSSSVV